ncbi:MAG: hypothetical protein AAB929_01780 [Patescibacteria group bacterium]
MGWKVYFWFLTAFMLSGYLWQGFFRIWEIVDLIISVISLIGLYAFSWRKKIITLAFWKTFFFICIIWNICYQYLIPLPSVPAEVDLGGISKNILAMVLWTPFIPLMIALYFYGFRELRSVDEEERTSPDRKGSESMRVSLGIFNILWFLVLCFTALASQFQMISLAFLGVGYLILAIGLFAREIGTKKLFLFGLLPLSILAILNLTIMGTPAVASYFRMTLKEQIQFAAIFMGIPIVLNGIYLTLTEIAGRK